MFAVLIALAILGIGLYYVIVVLERIFAGWADRQGRVGYIFIHKLECQK